MNNTHTRRAYTDTYIGERVRARAIEIEGTVRQRE